MQKPFGVSNVQRSLSVNVNCDTIFRQSIHWLWRRWIGHLSTFDPDSAEVQSLIDAIHNLYLGTRDSKAKVAVEGRPLHSRINKRYHWALRRVNIHLRVNEVLSISFRVEK